MSSIILLELFDIMDIQCSKRFIVPTGREVLAEFVRLQMEERNWSTYNVVERSGGLITSNSTVWNVVNLRVKNVTERVLRGFAKAFEVPPEKVFDIYHGRKPPKPETGARFTELALKFDRLPDNKKVNGEALIELLDREFERLARE